MIDEHKRRVVEEMKAEFENSSKGVRSAKERVDEALKDSNSMKEDIVSSMNSVILEVMDHEFRSVMNQYYNNLDNIREICTSKCETRIKVKTLSFKDSDAVCQDLIEGLTVEWNLDEDSGQKEAPGEETPHEYQSRPRARAEQESDRENPIECLETEERKPTGK